jgi:hypothetical protein
MEEYEEAMKSYKNAGGIIVNDGNQPLDPTDSAIAESSATSPNITSPDNHHHLPTILSILENGDHKNDSKISQVDHINDGLSKDSINNTWEETIIPS